MNLINVERVVELLGAESSENFVVEVECQERIVSSRRYIPRRLPAPDRSEGDEQTKWTDEVIATDLQRKTCHERVPPEVEVVCWLPSIPSLSRNWERKRLAAGGGTGGPSCPHQITGQGDRQARTDAVSALCSSLQTPPTRRETTNHSVAGKGEKCLVILPLCGAHCSHSTTFDDWWSCTGWPDVLFFSLFTSYHYFVP